MSLSLILLNVLENMAAMENTSSSLIVWDFLISSLLRREN